MGKIQIKSLFGRWHEVTYEQALNFARWKAKHIYAGEEHKQKVVMNINSRLRGTQFSSEELYGSDS